MSAPSFPAGPPLPPATNPNATEHRRQIRDFLKYIGDVAIAAGTGPMDYMPSRSVAVNTTIDPTTDAVVLCNAALTVTLPPAADALEQSFHIKSTAAAGVLVTVTGDGTEQIDQLPNAVLVPNDSIHVYSDGAAWWIL